ncbi:MAG: DegQ family serine endoprotease [Deltaproteobacteria bacterium]|nr:DegQ family serine endoprotease [Deltaproteobacteria bacterium]
MGKINISTYMLSSGKQVMMASLTVLMSLMLMMTFVSSSSAKAAPESFSVLVKKASPSVVYISTKKIIKQRYLSPFGPNDPLRDFFERFYGDRMPRDMPQTPQVGLGTGFIIDKEGYILTNNHVVDSVDEIKVTLEDESIFEAKIIGRDPETDIALIKIDDAKDLKPLELGDSDNLEVGDWVVAIGNPYGLGHTVTAGIVSAKYRDNVGIGTFDNFIQTDASINPGNSGGPLMSIDGKVIGINSAIISQTGGSVGIGFAIPINMAKDLLPMLKSGKIVRGWLGVSVQDIDADIKDKLGLENENGALIASVTPGGPSEKAGLKIGDVIVSFQGKEIKDSKRLPYIVSSTPVGTDAEVVVVRKGDKKTFKIKLGERPGADEFMDGGQASRFNLGMELETLTPEKAKRYGISDTEGLLVLDVEYNSPAAEAGLRQGDVILEVDREKILTVEAFNKKLLDYKPGDKILLLMKRKNSTGFITLRIWKDEE